jgi:hypothetical protein
MVMQIRPCAEFCADFPDDSVEDDDGEIIQFGGRGVAEAIAAMLRGAGFEVSAPEHQHEHGWDFEVEAHGRRTWFQISLIDDFILQSKFYGSFFTGGRDKKLYAEVLTRLNDGLVADPRFTNVRWQTARDLNRDAPGTASPVVD